MALTFLSIEPDKGNAALLPNQPILQGCKNLYDGQLVVGDVVKLASNGISIGVTKAAQTDLPLGVVVKSAIKTGFAAGEYVSVFPIGSYCYLPVASTDVKSGDFVGLNGDGDIDLVTTAGNGIIGIAVTEPKAENDLIIIQIRPSIYEAGLALKQNNLNLGAGLEFTDTDMFAWAGEIPTLETVYTKVDTPEATGNYVYSLENGKYEVLVDDATFADDVLTITLAGKDYEYERNSEADRQDEFLNVVSE